MGKLHELLAVEPDLKAEAQRVISQLKSLFTEGKGRLVGQIRTYQPLTEGEEVFEPEITELATSVGEELSRTRPSLSAWIDAALQKETTNQRSKADLVVEGKVIFKDLPAPALLNLESKLAEIRQVYASIPTNDPAERWKVDEQSGAFVSESRVTYRTRKVQKAHVLYEATKEHPAQVQPYSEDVRAGTWTAVLQSGMLTPKDKRERLERVDELIKAVKQARMRANDIEVESIHLGDKLFNYING